MKNTTKAVVVVLADIAICALAEIAIAKLIRRLDEAEQKRH